MTPIAPFSTACFRIGFVLIVFFALISFAAAQPCALVPAGLVSWWPGDGNADDIQNGNDGTLQNGATFADGKVEQAFSFDGIDDYVEIPHNANLDPGTGSFSIEAWVKPAQAAGSQVVVSKYECGQVCIANVSNSFYVLSLENGILSTTLRDTEGQGVQTLIGTTAIAAGVFYHIAVVRDVMAGELRLYVDGMLDASAPLNAFASGAIKDDDGDADPFVIGASVVAAQTSKENFFSGLIDEVGFYNRALDPFEILAIFNAGSAGKCRPKCRDQVQVNSFTALTTKGLNVTIADDRLTLKTADKTGVPGIEFAATVTIKSGLIPINGIGIRYIQNVTVAATTLDYSPDPNRIQVLVPGATFPLLDRLADPPPPFYDVEFLETDPDGSNRQVSATDSPSLSVPITRTDPARQLQRVDGTSMFRMFLGCISDKDPTFQTLATLDWTLRYLGTLDSSKKFKQGKGAGISAQAGVLGKTIPVQVAPIANNALVFIDDSP